mgnify:FL=1
MTAWEQFGIVVLFALFMLSLLGSIFLLVRWILSWATKRDADWQTIIDKPNRAIAKRQKEWRDFFSVSNDDWRGWLAEQSARECASMERVTASLEKLSEKLDAHDDKVESRINGAMDSITLKLKPTRKP